MKNKMLLAFSFALVGAAAIAADAPVKTDGAKLPAPMSAEARQKMAGLHEKMASCLRSDRPMPECRDEMMSGCKETMGKEGCPMMGGRGGRGMRRGMMNGQGAGNN